MYVYDVTNLIFVSHKLMNFYYIFTQNIAIKMNIFYGLNYSFLQFTIITGVYFKTVIGIKSFQESSTEQIFGCSEIEKHFEKESNGSGVIKIDALLLFAKTLLGEILHHPKASGRSSLCINPQRMGKKMEQNLGVVSEVKNFVITLHNNKLCYSYDIPKQKIGEKDYINRCMTPNELVSMLFNNLFLSSRIKRKPRSLVDFQDSRVYCFNVDTVHVAASASALLITFLWIILNQFQNSSKITNFFQKVMFT